MLAIENKDEVSVMLVLEHQVDVVNQDAEGRTALHLAVRQGLLALVKLLVSKGASLTITDNQGKTPPQYAAAHSEMDNYFGNYLAKQQSNKHFHQIKSPWRNLVFQGGSVRGLAYPGALRALEEQDICRLKDIQRVGGTSAGAINALLVGLGYTLDEIDHLVGIKTIPNSPLPQIKFAELLDGEFGSLLLAAKNQDWKTLLGANHHRTWENLKQVNGVLVGLARLFDGTAGNAVGLVNHVRTTLQDTYQKLSADFGLCPGTKLETLFETLIRMKVSQKAEHSITTPVTFAELATYQDFKEMYFVGVNTETGNQTIFSTEAILNHSKIISHRGKKGKQKGIFHINTNCPELVAAFYGYNNPLLRKYLHQDLGVSLWTRDYDNNTALHIAAKQGNLQAVTNILSVDSSRATVTNKQGETPLSLSKNKEIIAMLQQYTQDVQLVSRNVSGGNKKSDESQKQAHMKMPFDQDKSKSDASFQIKQKQDPSTSTTKAEPTVTIILQAPNYAPPTTALIFSTATQAGPIPQANMPISSSKVSSESMAATYLKTPT